MEGLEPMGAPSGAVDEALARERLECLRANVFGAPSGARPRRREELVELAVETLGVARATAEEIYDRAVEEKLDASYAFELVRCGLAVVKLDGSAVDSPAVDTGNPQWLSEAPPPPEAVLERRMRASFRRLRSLVERHGDIDAAFAAFVREPDVEDGGYPTA